MTRTETTMDPMLANAISALSDEKVVSGKLRSEIKYLRDVIDQLVDNNGKILQFTVFDYDTTPHVLRLAPKEVARIRELLKAEG